jgi:SAM-dependent methyltransferase
LTDPDEEEGSGPNTDLVAGVRTAPRVFEAWDAAGRMDHMAEGHLPTAGPVLDAVDPPKDGVFLDIGCGVGYAGVRIKRRRPDVTVVAFDASPRLAGRAAAAGVDHALVADAANVPVRDGTIDAAFSMEVLYYLTDPAVAIREVARTLRPGGTFDLMVDFYEENPYSANWPAMMALPMARWSMPRWKEAFEESGFGHVQYSQVRPPPEVANTMTDRQQQAWARTVGTLHVRGTRG